MRRPPARRILFVAEQIADLAFQPPTLSRPESQELSAEPFLHFPRRWRAAALRTSSSPLTPDIPSLVQSEALALSAHALAAICTPPIPTLLVKLLATAV